MGLMTMAAARRLGMLAGVLVAATASAQSTTVTKEDYARAERLLAPHTTPLIDHAVEPVTWLDDGQLWYRDHDAKGDHYLRLDLASGKTQPVFDQAKLAKALGKVTGKPVKAEKLGVSGYQIAADGRYDIALRDQHYRDQHYLCDLKGRGSCVAKDGEKTSKDANNNDGPGVLSPDKKREAFIRDWNLWLREIAGGKETQLTRDGVKDYSYATDNAGWTHSDKAILVWSPDSKQIATFQQDQRKTGEMTLVGTNVGHPKVETWKYPLVGDKDITMIERVIIDVDANKLVRLKMPPDQHRSTQCDDVSCFGGWEDVQWAPDGKTLAFVSSSRDHKQAWLRVADTATGAVRDVFNEKVKTWFESGINAINWRYLPDSNAVLWWSQRSNWGHLYLYDLTTGKLKHAITKGDWNVAEVLRVDEKAGTLWFIGTGHEAGRDPYFKHFYKVGVDGLGLTVLTPEDADHRITLSPDGRHFVDTYSTTTEPPVTVLRDGADGRVVKDIARADISRLKAAGWVAPEKFTVKGRDGKTDLSGMMFKPSNFDPSKKYPIINYVYPGPQVGSIRTRGFAAAHGDNQALAELGFIVVAIDGMGTPYRSKAFHDAYYANIIDNTLPDQVAGMKELAGRYPWIDLARAGIWGHSGGGNATATAMFRYPDLFKVGIAESGNHDNRNYEDDWAEKWQGLLSKDKKGVDNYDAHANQNYAKDLKGHLLLAHGNMDDNVPPYQTWLVVDALIKANKDFDLLIFPNARHGYGENSMYMTRRRWDYFVRHLLKAEPPPQYELKMPAP